MRTMLRVARGGTGLLFRFSDGHSRKAWYQESLAFRNAIRNRNGGGVQYVHAEMLHEKTQMGQMNTCPRPKITSMTTPNEEEWETGRINTTLRLMQPSSLEK